MEKNQTKNDLVVNIMKIPPDFKISNSFRRYSNELINYKPVNNLIPGDRILVDS